MGKTYNISSPPDIRIGKLAKKPEASKIRALFPQVLASTLMNLLMLDVGLVIAYPTILAPARFPDYYQIFEFTDEQKALYATFILILQPIGAILSGLFVDLIGRKKTLLLACPTQIFGWILLYYASSSETIIKAGVLLGIGAGLLEANIVVYIGEICQPSIRGVLISCSGVFTTLGLIIIYFLTSITTWRTAALCCLCVPLATVTAICFVPETPLWLLSRGRYEEAEKSLQWLRGWVSPKAVEKEFLEIQRYSEDSNRCIQCQKAQVSCAHPPASAKDKIKELLRKRTLKPFILVIMAMFAFIQFSGLSGMRPYLVQIFQAFGVPMDANYATVWIGMLGFSANILCTMIIKLVGKRKIALFSMAGTCVSVVALAIYAYQIFPPGWNTFDLFLEKGEKYEDYGLAIVPLVLILSMALSGGLCQTIPWMLLSEVFPFKSRGIASGITAALNYIMAFITTKTYYNLETSLSLFGIICVYGVFDVFAFIFIYMFIPETEGRSFEDINIHFTDNEVKITDTNIEKLPNYDSKSYALPAVIISRDSNLDNEKIFEMVDMNPQYSDKIRRRSSVIGL